MKRILLNRHFNSVQRASKRTNDARTVPANDQRDWIVVVVALLPISANWQFACTTRRREMRSPFVYISRHPYRRTPTVCDGVVSLLTVPAGGWMIRTQQQRTCSSPGWSINQAIPFQETSAFYSSPHTPALSIRFTRFSFPSSVSKPPLPEAVPSSPA